MKTKAALQPLSLVALSLMLLIYLVGCGAEAPAPLPSVIHLPDGSQVVVMGNSDIGLTELAGSEDRGLINSGEILVVSQLPSGIWFTVVNPLGFLARVTSDPNVAGAIMRLIYDTSTGKFSLDCIRGICELGPDDQHFTTILFGNQGWLDLGGNFQGPVAFDLNPINVTYGQYIQSGLTAPTAVLATATPTITPTSTPDFAATATESCIQFNSQYPATPCP